MNGTRGDLTDNEGSLLCEIWREQPVTAYQLVRAYERSPVGRFNKSKGQVYPLIRRLAKRGLVEAAAVCGDRRGTEQLTVTPAGEAVLRDWSAQVLDHHTLLEDPLRTKMLAFGLLGGEQILDWIDRAQAALMAKREQLEAYGATASGPLQSLIHANALLCLDSRFEWLGEVRLAILAGNEK